MDLNENWNVSTYALQAGSMGFDNDMWGRVFIDHKGPVASFLLNLSEVRLYTCWLTNHSASWQAVEFGRTL